MWSGGKGDKAWILKSGKDMSLLSPGDNYAYEAHLDN